VENGERSAGLLTTWKEIAAYLGVTVRTAQKWELERRLPVHRVPGGRGRVWARTKELDQWQRSVDSPRGETQQRAAARPRWGFVAVGPTVLALLVVAGVLGYRWWIAPAAEPGSFTRQGGVLIVYGEDGRELWRKPTPRLWRFHAPERGRRMAQVVDITGDSRKEVLAVVGEGDLPVATVLSCFDSAGRELWRFTPGREVRVEAEAYRPPFQVRAFAVRPGPSRQIAVISAHDAYFPSQLAILDGEGNVLAEYWHSGYFYSVRYADLDGDGGPELYAGGTSNARNMADLVVFDPDRVAGASREPPDYQLLGFEPGTEIARIFFPPTCLARAATQRNIVIGLRLMERALIVETQEGAGAQALIHRRFTAGLALEAAEPTDGFLTAHERYRRMGSIDHVWTPDEEASLREIILERVPPGS